MLDQEDDTYAERKQKHRLAKNDPRFLHGYLSFVFAGLLVHVLESQVTLTGCLFPIVGAPTLGDLGLIPVDNV